MKQMLAIILWTCATCAMAQTADQPGTQYASYTILLVPHQGDGFMVGIDRNQKIVFVPIPEITQAVDKDGVLPVRYGDLLQLVKQLGEENQRLKAENDHLWKVAEKSPAQVVVQPAAPVVVQQQPRPDPDAERREMRSILLRSLLSPRSSTVNVNVTDCTKYPALCVGR